MTHNKELNQDVTFGLLNGFEHRFESGLTVNQQIHTIAVGKRQVSEALEKAQAAAVVGKVRAKGVANGAGLVGDPAVGDIRMPPGIDVTAEAVAAEYEVHR